MFNLALLYIQSRLYDDSSKNMAEMPSLWQGLHFSVPRSVTYCYDAWNTIFLRQHLTNQGLLKEVISYSRCG